MISRREQQIISGNLKEMNECGAFTSETSYNATCIKIADALRKVSQRLFNKTVFLKECKIDKRKVLEEIIGREKLFRKRDEEP